MTQYKLLYAELEILIADTKEECLVKAASDDRPDFTIYTITDGQVTAVMSC